MSAVVDTSVLMCMLLEEPGRERAHQVLAGATMSSVNLAEVVAKCIERSVPLDLARHALSANDVSIIDFLPDDGSLAGELWSRAPKGKFSLGDRACIATGMRLGATVYTADRHWAALDLGIRIELIR